MAEGNERALCWCLQPPENYKKASHVSKFLDSVEASNEHLEANLSTMLQSVRGTKQYWFLRQSELKCMIREWG